MVPSRYVRPDQIQTVAVDGGDVVPKIPVIDLKRLGTAMQLVNHGISSSLVEKMKSQVVEFFNLPMEEKKKLWQCPGDVEGFGQTFVVSEEQKLDWSDMFYLVTHPTHLRKPHLLPKFPLPFRDTMESYSLEIKNLAATLLKQIGKALKIENDEEIKDLIDNMRQTMRMNYYPPCPQPDKVMGLPPHSDAFVVNIGDILEIITNGAYRSIEHRAMVSRDKARLSIGLFHSPRYDGETGPASSLITEETPALYKRITIREFYNGLFSRQLDGKTYIDTLKINHEQNH
ncbi:Protein SRG1 [Linum perenne]